MWYLVLEPSPRNHTPLRMIGAAIPSTSIGCEAFAKQLEEGMGEYDHPMYHYMTPYRERPIS
jgi:hypothetical protein